jgi:hypothetical protein
VDLKDVVGIRVRDVVGIGLTLDMMRFTTVLWPDAPDADHLNGAAEVVLDVLEGLGEVGGVHDFGDGQQSNFGSRTRNVNVAVVGRLARRRSLRFGMGELGRIGRLNRSPVLVSLNKVVLEFKGGVRTG